MNSRNQQVKPRLPDGFIPVGVAFGSPYLDDYLGVVLAFRRHGDGAGGVYAVWMWNCDMTNSVGEGDYFHFPADQCDGNEAFKRAWGRFNERGQRLTKNFAALIERGLAEGWQPGDEQHDG